MRLHATDVKITHNQMVDGMDCVLLEWPITADKAYEAFGIMSEPLKAGGTLKVYTAPAFGYVLPRVECITASGQLETLYEATQFEDVDHGIYMPKKMKMSCASTKFYNAYEFSSFEKINDVIPADDFKITLPENVTVSDSRRAGKEGATVIRTGEPVAISSSEVDKFFGNRKEGSPWLIRLLFLGTLLGGIVCFYIVRKLRSKLAK